ncbi:TIGR04222 domain-containing membrane protein [Burkholderia sp. Bp9142]|uniref:TIGR04222 domain-containing membrane protein n=1 Tax=Burkholderia sp. Bp9142 TaxID=2184573 RepID=UPI000F597A61|nr:TIGR04222 domain-containing membrane protein [Burkholderia sp. Bp9142]RQR25555.1 TIGR04222 domain-containing membrane protein [Burkholderia sp. Bp9142]
MAAIPSLPAAGDARALTDAQQALLTRLLAYSTDDPHAVLPYSRRLAEAEGWTHAHALAVIDEYKRFAFLAQAAGHPVTPSVAVDAAWHFHLQYTVEYWDVFCADVLRARLHHMPGTGAPDEAAVYARRYQDTLDSYRRLFGREPPASIWPRPESRPADAGSPQARAGAGADRQAEPPSAAGPAARRTWRDRLPKAAVSAAAASVIATAASARDFDVLNYTGPQFLAFYLPVCVVALLLIVVLQQIEYRCRRRRAQAVSSGLTAEEAAYLAGDESRAVQVATLSLVQAGAIDLSMAGRLGARVRSVDPMRGGAYADECHWLAAQPDGEASFGAFRQLLARRVSDAANALRGRGWQWAAGEMRAARMASCAIALAVLGTGAAKLAVGLSRGRPVLLLVISMVVFAIAYRIVARRLTGFGRGGLTVGARTALAAHRSARRDEPDSPDALLWATALFGAGALAGTAWAAHSMVLMEPPPVPPVAARSGGSSGSTYSSTDSNTNCSSSGSCSSSSCSSSSCGGCSSSS